MSDKSRIAWTDATWNPVTGCTKVSAGCKNCYAEREWKRLAANPKTRYYGRKFTDVQCHEDVLELPLHWKKPRRIFVNSMSDLFHDDVPEGFIKRVLGIVERTPQHTYQILTKRAARMSDYFRRHACPPNVWLGVSVENQEAADERILMLRHCPGATVRWVSIEPMLGAVDLERIRLARARHPGESDIVLNGLEKTDWVVCGGESGPRARPMHPWWVRSLRDQCVRAGVPFFFKQWGRWYPMDQTSVLHDRPLECVHVVPDGTVTRGEPPQWTDDMLTLGRFGKKLPEIIDTTGYQEFPPQGTQTAVNDLPGPAGRTGSDVFCGTSR